MLLIAWERIYPLRKTVKYFFVSDGNGVAAGSKASGVLHKLITDAFKTNGIRR